eukprot:tig00021721_g23221.t1
MAAHVEYAAKIVGSATVRDAKKAHTVYIVEVKKGAEPSWRLYKRYSQFDEFNDQLKERFPRIPKFPGKRFFGDSMEASFVQKRRAELDTYLQGLLIQQAIASSVVVRAFLESDKDVQPLNMTDVAMVDGGRPGPSGAGGVEGRGAAGSRAEAQQQGSKQKTREDVLKEISDRAVASMIDITQAPEGKETGEREKMISQRAAQMKELTVGTFALPRVSPANTAAAVPELLSSTALTSDHTKRLEGALERINIGRPAGA